MQRGRGWRGGVVNVPCLCYVNGRSRSNCAPDFVAINKSVPFVSCMEGWEVLIWNKTKLKYFRETMDNKSKFYFRFNVKHVRGLCRDHRGCGMQRLCHQIPLKHVDITFTVHCGSPPSQYETHLHLAPHSASRQSSFTTVDSYARRVRTSQNKSGNDLISDDRTHKKR